jgi:hypothetical protein
MSEECGTLGRKEKCVRGFVGKFEEKRTLGKPRR